MGIVETIRALFAGQSPKETATSLNRKAAELEAQLASEELELAALETETAHGNAALLLAGKPVVVPKSVDASRAKVAALKAAIDAVRHQAGEASQRARVHLVAEHRDRLVQLQAIIAGRRQVVAYLAELVRMPVVTDEEGRELANIQSALIAAGCDELLVSSAVINVQSADCGLLGASDAARIREAVIAPVTAGPVTLNVIPSAERLAMTKAEARAADHDEAVAREARENEAHAALMAARASPLLEEAAALLAKVRSGDRAARTAVTDIARRLGHQHPAERDHVLAQLAAITDKSDASPFWRESAVNKLIVGSVPLSEAKGI